MRSGQRQAACATNGASLGPKVFCHCPIRSCRIRTDPHSGGFLPERGAMADSWLAAKGRPGPRYARV